MKINEILSPSIRQVLKPRRQEHPMWQQRQSCDSDFCRAVVANGYMTREQMQEAAQRYRLGCSRGGGVIFWQIDTLEQTCDGKIMYYRPDCHRDHQRHPQWVSNLLKHQFLGRFPEMAPWMPETHHCLFGTHLVMADGRCQMADVCFAVVEAEKTAVILSAHYPQYLWLAPSPRRLVASTTLTSTSAHCWNVVPRRHRNRRRLISLTSCFSPIVLQSLQKNSPNTKTQ